MKVYDSMSRKRLCDILSRIKDVRIGLIGDVCLDVYWHADMRKSELSRESPHYPLPIVEERMSPGGGANAAANMAALAPRSVRLFGAVGTDWRAGELTLLLEKLNVDHTGVIPVESFITNAYIKPLRKGHSDVVYEDPRLDFTSPRPIPREAEDRIIAILDDAVREIDILCVSDQMSFGVISERVRQHICTIAGRGFRVVADSRYHIDQFPHCILKPNELEGAKAAGLAPSAINSVETFAQAALLLSKKAGSGILMTLGARGSLYVDERQAWSIPAHEMDCPIDSCGAGDSSLSGFALSIAAGAEPWEAAYIAGLCSEVTIRQIGVTGTASQEQLLDWFDQLRTRK